MAKSPGVEPSVTPEAVEKALLQAENGDPEALRAVLAPAPVWHTPSHNLLGGDHMGREQVIQFLRDQREWTGGTFHVAEAGPMALQPEGGTLRLHARGKHGGRTLDVETKVRFRLESGRVAELWLDPADPQAWDRFWSP